MAREKPTEITWEITARCGMNCRHCSGTAVRTNSEAELSISEAMTVCKELVDLGVEQVRITGGNYLLKTDFYPLIELLSSHGISTSLITDAWQLDRECILRMRTAGLSLVSISLDGLSDTHDYIRRSGSYDRALKSLDLLAAESLQSSVITTLNRMNVKELPGILEVIKQHNVAYWQLQPASPIGNLKEHRNLLLCRNEISEIIDFVFRSISDNRIKISPACSLRFLFHDFFSTAIESLAGFQSSRIVGSNLALWNGCPRGRLSFSILNDGSIVGCYGQRQAGRVEGNVRREHLTDIWYDESTFTFFKSKMPPCFFPEARKRN